MTDPLGLASSAASKIGSAVAAGNSRRRDERRQVYRRFQDAVVVYAVQIRDSRLSPEAMALEPSQRKPYVDALMAATAELAKALYEVRLVGNPGPTEAAEAVHEAISNSFNAAARRREALSDTETMTFAHAMSEFIKACRIDLMYQTRWWQPWRIAWWRGFWRRLTRRRIGQVGSRQSSADSPTHDTQQATDVVFGMGRPGYSVTNTGILITDVVLGDKNDPSSQRVEINHLPFPGW